MAGSILLAGGVAPRRGDVLRLCLDINVYATDLLCAASGRNSSSTQILELARAGRCSLGPVQLVVSWTMLETLRMVLTKEFGRDDAWVDLLVRDIADIAAGGALDRPPQLLLGGAGTHPIRDAEDGTVLDAALAGEADILVTGDVDDFLAGGKSTLPTELIATRGTNRKGPKPAVAAIPRFERPACIVGLPQEAILLLTRGVSVDVETLRAFYGSEGRPETPRRGDQRRD